jgi:oxygen-independent coproporphyrinogen III oxidase
VLTQEGGYVAIGLDHYALPSDTMAEAAAARRLRRSFQGYTTDAAPALIGFGASSIGSLPQGYVQNAPTAAAYAREIEAGRLAAVRGVATTTDDRLRRDVIERVMCDLEVDVERVAAAHGADAAPLKAAASEGIRKFKEDALASWDGQRIVVSERGRPFVRSIAALFDAYLDKPADKPRHARAV